jgi:hypothetical protein
MSGTFYKALGFATWKGAKWWMRHRARGAKRMAGAGAAGAALAAAATGIVILLRRNGHHGRAH